jgi:hypothetical protein
MESLYLLTKEVVLQQKSITITRNTALLALYCELKRQGIKGIDEDRLLHTAMYHFCGITFVKI